MGHAAHGCTPSPTNSWEGHLCHGRSPKHRTGRTHHGASSCCRATHSRERRPPLPRPDPNQQWSPSGEGPPGLRDSASRVPEPHPHLLYDDNTPPRHPSSSPAEEVCFISRDEKMDIEEGRLQLALLAASPGGPQDVSLDAMLVPSWSSRTLERTTSTSALLADELLGHLLLTVCQGCGHAHSKRPRR